MLLLGGCGSFGVPSTIRVTYSIDIANRTFDLGTTSHFIFLLFHFQTKHIERHRITAAARD